MIFLAVLLFIFAGWKVLTLFALQILRGQSITTEYTEAKIAISSITTVLVAVVAILAGLALIGVLG